MHDSPLMTVEECEKRLGVNRRTIVALVETGRWIGAQKVGRRYIISRAAFDRLYVQGITDHGDTDPDDTIRAIPDPDIPFLRRVS